MSWSLCKKGLEVLDEGTGFKQRSVKAVGKVTKRKKHLINNGPAPYFSTKQKSALELYEKYSTKDKTEENIKALQKIDLQLSKEGNAIKVKQHHWKKLNEKKLMSVSTPQNKKGSTGGSVFTEEDFERMNNEWLALM